MSLLRWIAGFTIALLLAAFAVANRQTANLYWSPFHGPLHVPLYMPALGFMAAGFLVGIVMMGLNSLPLWWASKKQKKQIRKLEQELQTATLPEAAAAKPYKPALPFFKRKI